MSVAADHLRFGSEPETEVRFHGSPGRDTASGDDRTNLPEPVEAATDYRDVRVDYRLATALRRGDGRRLRESRDPANPREDRENRENRHDHHRDRSRDREDRR